MSTIGGAYNKETAAHMRMRQVENMERSKRNPNENQAYEILCTHKAKPTRQAVRGWRVFDFWWPVEWAALELDGPEHNAEFDEIRDRYNFARSGILVYRAVNGDVERVKAVAAAVRTLGPIEAREPSAPLYKDAAKARDEWEKIRCSLDPRREGTEQPPIKTQR